MSDTSSYTIQDNDIEEKRKVEKNIITHENETEHKRTVLDFDAGPTNISKYIFGTFIYIIIFVILIPILLIKHDYLELLTAYFPNIDMIAAVLGYNGGPNIFNMENMWLYLYNPSNFTIFGFISTNIMNYFALLGATLLISYTTYKNKSWKKGWSMAFIMLFLTYLAPGNLIVILQNKIGKLLESNFNFVPQSNLLYLLVVLFGLMFSSSIVLLESNVIKHLQPSIIRFISWVIKHLT